MKVKLSKEVLAQLKCQTDNLLEFCQMHKIPMFMSFCTENTEEKTTYYNQMYGAKANNIHLYDDQIERHLLIANGFVPVPKRESIDINMSKILGDEIFTEELQEKECLPEEEK